MGNRELELTINGKGEVLGHMFTQVAKSDHAYIYAVSGGGAKYWEVFKKDSTPVCIDFSKRLYSETETRDRCPSAKDFGVWAWIYTNKERAYDKFNELNEKAEAKRQSDQQEG